MLRKYIILINTQVKNLQALEKRELGGNVEGRDSEVELMDGS